MQSPSIHQKKQQETTSRTTTTTATTATTTTASAFTATGSNNKHHDNNNSNSAGLSSSESSGALLDSKANAKAKARGESTRNVISEQVTSERNSSGSNSDSNDNINSGGSISSSSIFQTSNQPTFLQHAENNDWKPTNNRQPDQRIKVTLSAPRTASLSDQQIEPVLFESAANIPASFSSSTLSSNLVANSNNISNNSNYNGSKRRQSTATLISASGCATGTSSLTNVQVQIQPNQDEQAEGATPIVNHQYNQKERVEENLRRIASQRLSRGKQTTTSTVSQQAKVERSSQESPKESKQTSPIKHHQQQQQARNQLQANQNNQLSADQDNNHRQLAIYINGKIRSNSIFCQSTSANSFSSLLNRFSGGSNNNNNSSTSETTNAATTTTQTVKHKQQQQPSRLVNQIDHGTGETVSEITPNHQADNKQQSLCQRLKQKSFKWNGKRPNKLVEQTISKDQQLKQGGRNKVFSFSYNAKRFFTNHLLTDNAHDDDESASLTNNQPITSNKDSKEGQKKPLCEAGYRNSNLSQTSKDLATLAAETKVIIESETSESSEQQQTSNNQEQEQGQQTTKTSYKLNPSSMFLRKAMRYYRLWIYCTNITILLGTLIFILSTIYVMSDYRFRLLVSKSPIRQSFLAENNYDRTTATTNHNYNGKQQQQSIIKQADKSSLPLKTILPSNPNQTPLSQFANGGSESMSESESEKEKDFDIHINYSEPSVILAYAVIAIQAGILQAIGCFGAIRMKERWIQAFWYLILGLTVFDVVFLLYWLNRYEFIVNSLQQHMKFRLREHYGSFFVETESETELGRESKTIPNQLTSISGSIIENYLNFASIDPSIELLDRNNHDYYPGSTRGSKRSSRSTLFTGGGELSIVLNNELHSQMDKILTEIIDKIQTDSQCCGISNSLDYKRSKWRQIKLDQLRVRLNWTETGAALAEQPAIEGGTTRDKRISDLNVAANLLRRVPLVPASCCKPIKRDKALKTNRRDNQPVILDDSQIERAPRVPAWSPSMVVENLQDSTANVRRRVNSAAVSATNQLAIKGGGKGEVEEGDNRDSNEANIALDSGDEQEDEGGREDYDVYSSDNSNSNSKKRKKYPEGEKRNKLAQNNELSLADMLDTRWSSHEMNSERDHKIPTRDGNIILAVNSRPGDDDEDFYNNLNNQQRRLWSKQENFNYPPRAVLEERNERDGYNTDTNQRRRRWLVESRVDEREQVLSRYIEDLKEEFQAKKDSTTSNKEYINNEGKLNALRGFLFRQVSCNLSTSSNSSDFLHDKLDKTDRSCDNYTSDENFKWPNKLQLSFNQYKVLESYLLLDDNLTNNNGEMSDVGANYDADGKYENEPYDDGGLSSRYPVDNYKHHSRTVGIGDAVEPASRVIGQNGTNWSSFGLSIEEMVKNKRGEVSDRAMKLEKATIRKRNVGTESELDEGEDKTMVEDQHRSKLDKTDTLSESKRLRLELAEAIRSDSDTTCAPRSYFDQATIYTHGCHPVIKSWLDSSAHILFVTGFCVLTVLKFCSVVLLRLEIKEMIHKIRVLKGMATEYNALHDLEAYLPRPSICAQAAELTPSGVAAAIAASPTTNQSGSCCIGGVISCNTGTINQQPQPQQQQQQQSQSQQQQQQQQQHQPPLFPPPRLGGSFSEAVVAAATAAAASQQQQQHYPFQHQHSTSISNQPSINLFGQLGFGLTGSSCGRATSMKAMTGMANMLTPELCPRSSSASSAHLQATTFLASQKHALSLRSELFQPSSVMSRRHTAVSVCPAAAAAAAAAAHHLMSRRGTYVANPVFNAAPLINSGLNLNQHRHSAHTLGCASSFLKPPLRQQLSGPKPNQACHCLLSSCDSTQINEPNSTTCPSGVNYGHHNDHSQQQNAHFEHQSSVESNHTQQHLAGQVNTQSATTSSNQATLKSSKQNRGSQQLLSLVYPFKRQSSGGAQSACNFSLDLSPPMITESRRSIH